MKVLIKLYNHAFQSSNRTNQLLYSLFVMQNDILHLVIVLGKAYDLLVELLVSLFDELSELLAGDLNGKALHVVDLSTEGPLHATYLGLESLSCLLKRLQVIVLECSHG
jgi:hypothetical protein